MDKKKFLTSSDGNIYLPTLTQNNPPRNLLKKFLHFKIITWKSFIWTLIILFSTRLTTFLCYSEISAACHLPPLLRSLLLNPNIQLGMRILRYPLTKWRQEGNQYFLRGVEIGFLAIHVTVTEKYWECFYLMGIEIRTKKGKLDTTSPRCHFSLVARYPTVI